MININCIENKIHTDGSQFSYFIIQPLDIGNGLTLGNALRRSLLNDIYGSAIEGVRINNIKSEFTEIPGVKEDTLAVLMNIREIILKKNIIENLLEKKVSGFLHVHGPKVITAGMFNLPKNKIQILNPHQYICSILTPTELYIEIDIKTEKGYSIKNYNERYTRKKKFYFTKGSTLLLDTIFNPVKLANYKVKLIYDSNGNIKESLHLEILTNGTMTPYRAFLEANKILLNIVLPIFNTTNFLKLNSTIFKNYKEN